MPEKTSPQEQMPRKNEAVKPDHSTAKRASRSSKSAASKKSAKRAETARTATKEPAAKKETRRSRPESQSRGGSNRNRGRKETQPKKHAAKLDRKKVAKRAWKIFFGEVNEEGLALISDSDARELARRSLHIAEIYSLEEAASLPKRKKKKAGK